MNNPLRAVYLVIAINVAVFVGWAYADPIHMATHFLVSWDAVASGRVWTLFTSTISHYDAMHLLFNMIGIYVFGRQVVAALGERAFVELYLAGGLLASVAHVGFNLFTGSNVAALGASGAVMAIAVVYAFLFPRQTLLINFFIPVPAALAVALFILIDLVGLGASSTVGGGGLDNVAHAAHLGGAAFGAGYYWWRVRPRLQQASDLWDDYIDRQR